MTHERLWSVLDAQSSNATLAGEALRQAGMQLAEIRPSGRTVLMAFDAAGERILGTATTVAEQELPVYDYTTAFPARTTCLLVGGYVAGPVGIAAAAAAATRAGAARVEVALLGGWPKPIIGVSRVRTLNTSSGAVVAS